MFKGIYRAMLRRVYRFAYNHRLRRLEQWAYIKWFNSYMDKAESGFFEFAEDFFRSNISSYAASFLEI